MSNVQQLIKKYNNFIQNKKNKTILSCNCRDKNECPLKSDTQLQKKIIFFFFNNSPSKMMKNAFYFIFKGLLFSKYLNYCLDLFGM